MVECARMKLCEYFVLWPQIGITQTYDDILQRRPKFRRVNMEDINEDRKEQIIYYVVVFPTNEIEKGPSF